MDSSFEEERRAAEAAGLRTALVDDGELAFGGDVRLVGLPRLEAGEEPGAAARVVYRGWILREGPYRRVAEKVAQRGYRLLTSPEAYMHCYHLPEWYGAVEETGLTPRSIWMPGAQFDPAEVAERVEAAFGGAAVILKDYVKSRKHEWFEACFIPDGRDREVVAKVVGRFLELQDGELVGGLVFREFWPTRQIGTHRKSRAPLANEHRFFVLCGEVFFSAPYWDDVEYDTSLPSVGLVAPVLARAKSPFFAVDVVEREGGGWFVVELNDGGTAGLPRPDGAGDFYAALRRSLDGGRAGVGN